MSHVMTGSREKKAPAEILAAYRLPDCDRVFLIGSYDDNVTVLSQQIRALNLAYGLVETPDIWKAKPRIAIVGAGFAGLTLAAALIQKKMDCTLTLFEERDTLLPLQQGSDSRWLHPQIYEWPATGSEASAAMLPVLNWTAGRASDVVVQVVAEWRRVVEAKDSKTEVRLYCNTRHVQVGNCEGDEIQIEWVGDQRDPQNGDTQSLPSAPEGASAKFDLVFLAVGFGLEKEAKISYWRNETLGQPNLSQDRTTYLVSGQGDGAMIDLLRLRISQYRQDRILDELFAKRPRLMGALKALRIKFEQKTVSSDLFEQFEKLEKASGKAKKEFDDLLHALRRRLRRDTSAILQMKVKSLSDLLNPNESRISFQNALLVYLLYKCGGFAPTSEQNKVELRRRYGIEPEHMIIRRGVQRDLQFSRILPKEFSKKLENEKPKQAWNTAYWPGGYFSQPGPRKDASGVADSKRGYWRKEYLPGPAALLAAGIAGAAAGWVRTLRPDADHFRLTLHRVISVNGEPLLQQTCDYVGVQVDHGTNSAAGRTFGIDLATIGQAYGTRQVVRSRQSATAEELQDEMKHLRLDEAARKMKPEVDFLLAIPVLQPDATFYEPSPVLGVLFVDSRAPGFWLKDEEVTSLCNILQSAVRALEDGAAAPFNRIRNVRLGDVLKVASTPQPLAAGSSQLEIVADVQPPRTVGAFHLNFEHSDLTPLA